jgi:SAM-dependent methyltransferase
MSGASRHVYVCGHSLAELERLERQAAFFADISRKFLETAGAAAGMRVLDIGCGIGDFSFLAAHVVGTRGSVLGIDHAPEPIARAETRAQDDRVANIEFRHTAIADLPPGPLVDAVIGRFVLMHQADPSELLRVAARHVRPGGIVAFLESHMSGLVEAVHSWPHSPIYDRIVGLITDVIRAAGAHADMGLRLRSAFLAAGLPAPRLWMQARVEGGPDAPIYRYVADSLRSMLPLAERFGITQLREAEIDELERQLRDEVTATGGVLTSPILVGAWCRVE